MKEFDIAVLGSGPAGVEIEAMLQDPEKRICIIEKNASSFGGVCANKGCMPTKHLVKCADIISTSKKANEFNMLVSQEQVDLSKIIEGKKNLTDMLSNFHLNHTNAELMFGHGRFKENKILEIQGENGEKELIKANEIVIATGSRPKTIPGIEIDGHYIVDSNHMLDNTDLPESLLIVGGGVIGLEFASIYNTYGSEVTIIEAAPVILPNEDSDTGMMVKGLLEKRGISIHENVIIESAEVIEGMVHCSFKNSSLEDGKYDKVLIAVGRTPNTDDIGLENTDISSSRGFIDVNEYLETSVPGIHAAGDVISTMMLAHVALYESMVITSNMKDQGSMKNINNAVPRVIFTDPEIAGVGMTEREAREKYGDIKVINFPMEANGKNVIDHQTEGRIKLIFKSEDLTVLGASIIGKSATEIIHLLTLAVTHDLTYYDLRNTIHAHPTTAEVVWFAVLKGRLMDSTESFMEMMKIHASK